MAVMGLFGVVTITAVLQHVGHTLGVDTKKIHQHMTPQELRSVFHVDRHDQVPEYEVVTMRGRSTTPYAAYHSDNIGPPGDIWTVLQQIRQNKAGPGPGAAGEGEGKRRGPDRITDIEDEESEEVHDRVMTLSAFGKDLELKLRKTKGLLGKGIRMWETLGNASNTHGIEYTEIPQTQEDIGELYQDEYNQAALLVHSDKDGGLLVEGTIGHDLVVKPVPSSVRHLLPTDDEMFLDGKGEDLENDVTMDTGRNVVDRKREAQKKSRERRGADADADAEFHKHVVYRRRTAEQDDTFSDYAFMEPDSLKKVRTRRSISKREAPYVIFPEILVIVDYDGYRLHGGDNVQIKRYFVSFWNGVDLRYKLLKGPKIRISIAGIIISRGRDATPYLERNRVGRDAIDSAAALTDMGKYLFRERRLPVYDIAVAVTKLDMCRRQFANDACNRGTAGFAYVGGACVVNKRLEKVNSVAIIEDTGGFSGIIVAAHEVGHLLGAVHDGSPPPSYLGGPGAEKCRWEDGFIMSDLRHTEKGFKWSSCSVSSFHHFLNGDTATCLFNSPHEDESLPRVLPGKLLSLDAQCRKDRGTSACFKDDRVCSQLFCFDAGSGYCVAYRPAAEGSPCGDGQYCINGRCVAEHENIIPDYSQNTPSYLRRDDTENLATQSRPVFALPNSTTQRTLFNEFTTRRTFPPPKSTTTTPKPRTTPRPDHNKIFISRTTEHPRQIFDNFFKTSTTESPDARAYREFYLTSTDSPDVVAYKEFYRTSTTESPDVVAYREFYRTSTTTTTESPDVVAYREFYKTSTTQATPTHSTKHPYDLSHLFHRSTTKSPYDFSEFDPQNINYFGRNAGIDNNSLGSHLRLQVRARGR